MGEHHEEQDVLSKISEDNEFFRRMLSLLPSTGTQELPEEGKEEVTAAAEKKKQRRKDKKREKHMKKMRDTCNSEETVTASGKQTAGVKHKSSDDAMEFTAVKPKKTKLAKEESCDSESDDDDDGEITATMAPSVTNKKTPTATQHIPAKHKKHHKKAKTDETISKAKMKEKYLSYAEDDNSSVPKVKSSPDAVVPGVVTPEADSVLTASISSIEDKRAKLREKIEQLKAKRNPTNRERLDRKKLKRQESKMKLKQKRKLEKLQAKQNKQNGESSKPKKGNLNKGASPVKPVYNKEGQMVFSKFDFTDSGKKEKLQTDLHGKDYKRLLEKIEKRNQKINKLKSKDEGAGKALEDKIKWQSVMHKAEGEKVKDNPELLKKALKRKQKIKEQKKKKWEKRADHVEKMKDERQKKRTENIQKRKQAVKDKKMQKLKKKGRILPGF